jgi:hypothetical protein
MSEPPPPPPATTNTSAFIANGEVNVPFEVNLWIRKPPAEDSVPPVALAGVVITPAAVPPAHTAAGAALTVNGMVASTALQPFIPAV